MLTLSESTAEASQHPFGANDRVLGFEAREPEFPVLITEREARHACVRRD